MNPEEKRMYMREWRKEAKKRIKEYREMHACLNAVKISEYHNTETGIKRIGDLYERNRM